ncbi:adhesion G-protein coupled receptor F3 [Fundulus diaphanus]
MKEEYSKIKGFDSLSITEFSVGSVVASFAMKVVSTNISKQLIDKSVSLGNRLNGSLVLETTGIVNLEVPDYEVPYGNKAVVKCTTTEDLNANPKWNLKRDKEVFIITNGSISTVTNIGDRESNINLNAVDELWEGEYICLFEQKQGNITINHKANASMDICLKPKIDISADPAFPLCVKETDVFLVKVSCQIKKSSENYNVRWDDEATPIPRSEALISVTLTEQDKIIYTAQKVIGCKKDNTNSVNPSCSFTNNCNQTQNQTTTVNVIYVGDLYCPAEGDWGNTKAGFTAEKKCSKQAGLRRRKCSEENGKGVWKKEVSECVEQELSNVLESAQISDIGLGELALNAAIVFNRFENVTKTSKLPGYANINISVNVLSTMKEKLSGTNLTNQSAIEDFLFSSSHLLNESLASSWNATPPEGNSSLVAENYVLAVEKLIERSEIIGNPKRENLEVDACNTTDCKITVFDAIVSLKEKGVVKTAGFKHLQNYLPYDKNKSIPNSIIVSTTAENKTNISITIDFTLLKPRPRNVMLHCVFWNTNTKNWSTDGCKWQGANEAGRCVCTHLSSFSILMSKEPLEVPGLTYLTYAALSVSVVSLIISLVIELIVWSEVVKTSTLYLRHTAHVNISLCLLIADLCFLASSQPKDISELWCRTSAVLKHFCYLAMFFWMFCLSATLLHQAVFLFHKVSKKNYLRFSLVIGYVCPLLIVFITFVTNDGGNEGKYYSKESCWLVYEGTFQGTIFTFIIPVGAIVFINVFSMLVVIMKLISHHSTTEVHKKNDISPEKEKTAAKIVVRSVVLLTPIFGVTWIFGFAILIIDLTNGTIALAVNYIFTALNGFQGFFILLTTCFGDRMTREALRKYLQKKAPASSVSESTTKSELTWKK